MERIKATNDLAFKKVLASKENTDILLGLINDFFGITPKNIVLQNPYSINDYREIIDGKEITVLRQTLKDITASMEIGDFTTELQVSKSLFFEERSLYYPFDLYCKNYNEHEKMKKDTDGKLSRYSSLKPVYSLNILDYEHFQDTDALRIFELYDPKRQKRMNKELIKIGYFELRKTNIETPNQRHWRDYFTTGEVSDDAPEYIKKATTIIELSNLGKEEKAVVDLLEKATETHKAEIAYSYQEGATMKAFEIATNLLKSGLQPSVVAENTALNIDDILQLKKNLSL